MKLNAPFLCPMIALDEGAGGSPKVRFQLLKTGEWAHPKAPNGKLVITDKELAEFEANFNAGVRGKELPTNLDHNDPSFADSPAWIVGMERSPGRLDAVIEVNDPTLADALKSKRKKYISAEIQFGWRNPADNKSYNVIKGAGFTNVPYIKNMEPAQFLNLSECAAEDAELQTWLADKAVPLEAGDEGEKGLAKNFKDALDKIGEEVTSHGWEEYDGCWKWCRKDLVSRYKAMVGASKEGLAKKVLQYQTAVTHTFKNVAGDNPEAGLLCAQWSSTLLGFADEAINKTYLDGPTEATPPHRPPTEAILAEVDSTGKGNRAYNNPAEDYSDKDADDDRSNVDDSGRLPSGADDPDADDPDLPSQCQSCQKLTEGSCPFQGIDVKTAAAGEGNCPQYVSNQTQLTPERQGPEGLHQTGGSQVHFSEKTNMDTPTISLADFQALQTQVASLSETVQAQATAYAKLEAEKSGLENRLSLSEQQAAENAKARDKEKSQAFVHKYLAAGKITIPQSELVLSMLALGRGEEVHLSDGATPATIDALLSEFLENIEQQVPLQPEGDGRNVDEAKGGPDKNVGLSDHEKLYPKMEARAKEKAAANGGNWTAYMSEAAREISREAASGGNR